MPPLLRFAFVHTQACGNSRSRLMPRYIFVLSYCIVKLYTDLSMVLGFWVYRNDSMSHSRKPRTLESEYLKT